MEDTAICRAKTCFLWGRLILPGIAATKVAVTKSSLGDERPETLRFDSVRIAAISNKFIAPANEVVALSRGAIFGI